MQNIARYGMLELTLPREGQREDQIPEAVFTLGEKTVRVRGFAENEEIGRVRFMPMTEGEWQYELAWGSAKEAGSFLCTPAQSHGPVRTEGCHFRYDDGTRFIPCGTTC